MMNCGCHVLMKFATLRVPAQSDPKSPMQANVTTLRLVTVASGAAAAPSHAITRVASKLQNLNFRAIGDLRFWISDFRSAFVQSCKFEVGLDRHGTCSI